MLRFYVVVEGFSDPRHRLSAFVVADDETEAKALMTADHRFDGCRMPPLELSADAENHPAAGERSGNLESPNWKRGCLRWAKLNPNR
jgi:hypothetical protein